MAANGQGARPGDTPAWAGWFERARPAEAEPSGPAPATLHPQAGTEPARQAETELSGPAPATLDQPAGAEGDRPAARHAQPSPSPPAQARKALVRRPAAASLFLAGLLAVAAGVAGLLWLTGRAGEHPSPLAASRSGVSAAAPLGEVPLGQVVAPPAAQGHHSVSRPMALTIPVIGVHTRLLRLGLTSKGTLQVPPTPLVAGWYTGSPRPGEVGSAIIVGHIDSFRGPGVFFRLSLLRPGNLAFVLRANRTLAVFRVYSVRTYAKNRFPTAAIYGPTPDPEVRLITCGGTFDNATRSYLSNVVVFARQIRYHRAHH